MHDSQQTHTHTHTQSHCNRTITLKRVVQQILMLNGKTIYVQDSQILSRYKPLNIEDSEVTCMTLNKTEDPQHKTDNTKLMTRKAHDMPHSHESRHLTSLESMQQLSHIFRIASNIYIYISFVTSTGMNSLTIPEQLQHFFHFHSMHDRAGLHHHY